MPGFRARAGRMRSAGSDESPSRPGLIGTACAVCDRGSRSASRGSIGEFQPASVEHDALKGCAGGLRNGRRSDHSAVSATTPSAGRGLTALRRRPLSCSTCRSSPTPSSGARAAACRREKRDNSSRQSRPRRRSRGLRPRRARLVLGVKVPNPRSSTRSPRASPAAISLKRISTASAMSRWWMDGWAAASRRISSGRSMTGRDRLAFLPRFSSAPSHRRRCRTGR